MISSQDEYSDEGESVSAACRALLPLPGYSRRAHTRRLARALTDRLHHPPQHQSSASIDPDIDFDLNYALYVGFPQPLGAAAFDSLLREL